MGRLHHLAQTMPSNLFVAPKSEFVICDYNSQDGLYEWARDNLKGKVVYVRTRTPQYFCAGHAKNIAHRHATGDILCNLDADNFLVPGFPEYLEQLFTERPNICVTSFSQDFALNHGCAGKIAVRREHFYSVNGYDEGQDQGWGWDDTNYSFRVRMHNSLELVELDRKWNRAIGHGNHERVKNYPVRDIEKTEKWSVDRLKAIAENKDYVANKGVEWGAAPDLVVGL
jgi:glycosyltransferase involved in cell wall biosynthesis